MKKPSPSGTPIDMNRISNQLNDFQGYRHSITELRIDRWLKQFNQKQENSRILVFTPFVTDEISKLLIEKKHQHHNISVFIVDADKCEVSSCLQRIDNESLYAL